MECQHCLMRFSLLICGAVYTIYSAFCIICGDISIIMQCFVRYIWYFLHYTQFFRHFMWCYLGGLTEKFEAEHIAKVQKMEILGIKSSSDMMS